MPLDWGGWLEVIDQGSEPWLSISQDWGKEARESCDRQDNLAWAYFKKLLCWTR